MKSRFIASALLIGLMCQLGGCVPLLVGGAAAGGYYVGKDPRTVGEIADDAAITAKVKTRLIEAKDVKALNINVDTFLSNVTLNGQVRSQNEATRAISIARGVPGVKKVVSKLVIVKPAVDDQSG